MEKEREKSSKSKYQFLKLFKVLSLLLLYMKHLDEYEQDHSGRDDFQIAAASSWPKWSGLFLLSVFRIEEFQML